MTSYNKPDYVAKSVRAVLEQTMGDFELLLMDDNSGRETQDAIAPYLRDGRVRFYCSKVKTLHERTRKTRYAVLINQAIVLSKGRYITYLTDDNIWHPDRLTRMSHFLDVHDFVNIVYSSSVTRHVNKQGKIFRTVERPAKEVTWCAPCMVDHCSVMHRRSILPAVYRRFGSFWDEDPQYYRLGDARFFWRLNHDWPFYPLSEVLDFNYITVQSLHHQLFDMKRNAFIRKLPPQKTCKELRDSLMKGEIAR